MSEFIVILIVLSIPTIIIFIFMWALTPQSWKCKHGFHNWMNPSYPWWGGVEQGTYCCDNRMKLAITYKNGRKVSSKRVPLTEEDYRRKAKRIEEALLEGEERRFQEKLRQDMKSDDYCEELLP